MSEKQVNPYDNNMPPHYYEDEISIKEILLKLYGFYEILKNKFWSILKWALLIGILTFCFLLAKQALKEDEYKSKMFF